MRMIDADALEKQIQEAYCAECDDYDGIRCRACRIDDALIQVDAAPTVDAIPVKWLNERHRRCCEEADTDLMDAITVLCNEYHVWREQEAR